MHSNTLISCVAIMEPLRHPDPENGGGGFNSVISVISVVLRETTLTISVSTGKPVSIVYEIVRSSGYPR